MEGIHRLSTRRALRIGGAALLSFALLAILLPLRHSQARALDIAGAKALWSVRSSTRYRLVTSANFHGRVNIHGGITPPCQRISEVFDEQEIKALHNTCHGAMIARRPKSPEQSFPIHPKYGVAPVDWRPSVADLFAEIEAHNRRVPVDLGECALVYQPAQVKYHPQLGYPSVIVFLAQVRTQWASTATWRYIWEQQRLPRCAANLRTTLTVTVRPLP